MHNGGGQLKILYIEDEEEKAREVMKCISNDNDVHLKKSYMSGVKAIHNDEFDIILLDMSLPLYDYESAEEDENDFETFAGIDIIEELIRINRKEKVIIITAFDRLGDDEHAISLEQLDEELAGNYKENYKGIIFYNSSSMEWRRILTNKLEESKNYENSTSR